MKAEVTTIRHANVLGQESQYIKIKTEKGEVIVKSGESTIQKLEAIDPKTKGGEVGK